MNPHGNGKRGIFVIPAAIILFSLPSLATAQKAPSTISVATVVTVQGSHHSVPPAIEKESVDVAEGKTQLRVTGWEPFKTSKYAQLQLAIILDNGLKVSVIGQHLEDLRNFVNSLPADTSVGLFRAFHGSAEQIVPFTWDHHGLADKIPAFVNELNSGSSSIYESLNDLASHWQPDVGVRHGALVVSGIDGFFVSDTYLDATIKRLQAAEIMLYPLYEGSYKADYTQLGGNYQARLQEIATATGGTGFTDANRELVSIAPYLNELSQILANQYLLTFQIAPSKSDKGELRSIDIHIEKRNLKVSYPKNIFVPGK